MKYCSITRLNSFPTLPLIAEEICFRAKIYKQTTNYNKHITPGTAYGKELHKLCTPPRINDSFLVFFASVSGRVSVSVTSCIIAIASAIAIDIVMATATAMAMARGIDIAIAALLRYTGVCDLRAAQPLQDRLAAVTAKRQGEDEGRHLILYTLWTEPLLHSALLQVL